MYNIQTLWITLSVYFVICASQTQKVNLTVHPTSLVQVPQGGDYEIWLDLSRIGEEPLSKNVVYVVRTVLSDPRVGKFKKETIEISTAEILSGAGNKSMSLYTNVLGELFINFTVHEKTKGVVAEVPHLTYTNYNVTIITQGQTADTIFTLVLTAGIIINTINMGCGLDMEIIIGVFKKPVGPIVGFISQFMFMPLFAFGISWVVFEQDLLRLGLFVIGVCPGGVASNFWTLLFDGDVNLSITMTFISSIAAMGMMPFWIWLLSPYYLSGYGHVQVPFTNLVISLVLLTLPLGIGLLIRKFKRNWADFITNKVVKPASLILMLAMTGLGLYSLAHIFILFDWRIVLSGFVLGWAGYIFGGVFAWICRLKRPQIIAISFETALQNGALGFVILKISLQQPYSELAALPAVSAMLFTSLTLFIVYLIFMCYTKLSAYKKNKTSKEYNRSRSDLQSPVSEVPLIPQTPLTPIHPPFYGGEVDGDFAWCKRAIEESQATAPPSPVYYPPTTSPSRRPLQRQASDAGTQTYYQLH